MKLSFLQVQHYYYTKLLVEARPGIDVQKIEFGPEPYPSTKDANVRTSVTLGEPSDDADPRQFAVTLEINCDPKSDSHFPYYFSVCIEGIFTIDLESDLEERKQIVVCNGASILYSAAREQLLSLTARHIFGPMLLPTASFKGLSPEKKI